VKNILGDSGQLQLILRKIPQSVMSSGNLAALPVAHLIAQQHYFISFQMQNDWWNIFWRLREAGMA